MGTKKKQKNKKIKNKLIKINSRTTNRKIKKEDPLLSPKMQFHKTVTFTVATMAMTMCSLSTHIDAITTTNKASIEELKAYINSFPEEMFTQSPEQINQRALTLKNIAASDDCSSPSMTIQRGSPTAVSYDGVSCDMIKDVDMTFAFCSQVANKECESLEDDTKVKRCKYEELNKCLSKIGWTVGGERYQNYSGSGGQNTVNSAIQTVLQNVLADDELKLVNSGLATAGDSITDDNYDEKAEINPFFAVGSNEADSTNSAFQLGVCKMQNGRPVIKFGYFDMQSALKRTTHRFLFWTSSSTSATFNSIYQINAMNLDMTVMDAIRDNLVEKLGDGANDYIDNFPDIF